MDKILFVCTGNTCRSPMAKALLEKIWAEENRDNNINVMSAGLFTSNGVLASVEAIQVMQEYGIDITNHEATQLAEEVLQQANLILTMTDAHRSAIIDKYPEYESIVHTLTGYLDYSGDIIDPFGRGIEAYYKTASQLEELIRKLVERLTPNG